MFIKNEHSTLSHMPKSLPKFPFSNPGISAVLQCRAMGSQGEEMADDKSVGQIEGYSLHARALNYHAHS